MFETFMLERQSERNVEQKPNRKAGGTAKASKGYGASDDQAASSAGGSSWPLAASA